MVCPFTGSVGAISSARLPKVKSMSRTVGAAIGVLIFVLFFASIGARFSRPANVASAPVASAANR
jgi:hypothetical protein